jgi:hypothetical protein
MVSTGAAGQVGLGIALLVVVTVIVIVGNAIRNRRR